MTDSERIANLEKQVRDLSYLVNTRIGQYTNVPGTQPLGQRPYNQLLSGTLTIGYNTVANIWKNTTNVLIGWIGRYVISATTYFGAWFQLLYAGGSDASAPALSTDSGGVTLTKLYLAGAISVSATAGSASGYLVITFADGTVWKLQKYNP